MPEVQGQESSTDRQSVSQRCSLRRDPRIGHCHSLDWADKEATSRLKNARRGRKPRNLQKTFVGGGGSKESSALLSSNSTALPGLVLARDARRLPVLWLLCSFIHLVVLLLYQTLGRLSPMPRISRMLSQLCFQFLWLRILLIQQKFAFYSTKKEKAPPLEFSAL